MSEARRLRIDLAYDGTAFAGWQLQRGRRTVQSELEAVLQELAGGRPVRVHAASRTDAGAHARQQVVHCTLACRLTEAGLERALGRLLPPDLRPLSVRRVPDAFHAQFDAARKTYRYRVDRTPHGDPFLARFALHHPHGFDAGRLRAALADLGGRRDWSGFADSRCRVQAREREMFEAGWVDLGRRGGWFVFSADGFLTHMVRNLVGTLLEIARGRRPPEIVEQILASGDRRRAAATAPAHALCLWRVDYAGESAAEDPHAELAAPWCG